MYVSVGGVLTPIARIRRTILIPESVSLDRQLPYGSAMSLLRIARSCALSSVLVAAVIGPTSLLAADPAHLPLNPPAATSANSTVTPLFGPPVENGKQNSAVEGESELSLPKLVAEVEANNPSLEATAAAWRASAQRYPQVIALDDPMFMAMAAPSSFSSNDVESAYAFQLNQKFQWYGKRQAQGGKLRPNPTSQCTTWKTAACD